MTHGDFEEYDGTIVDDFDNGTAADDDEVVPEHGPSPAALPSKTVVIAGEVIDVSTFQIDDDDDDDDRDEFDDEEDDMDEAAKARLAAALADIDAKFGRPPSEQVAAFTEAHQTLQATLNRIDTP